jgi:hypothetical protein
VRRPMHEQIRDLAGRRVSDPTLAFQLGQGFRVLGVVPHYLEAGPESLGFAAVIEWLNPKTIGRAAQAPVS